MMQDDDDHVYLVDSDTAGYLYVTKTQLRYRYLLDDLSSSFTALTLKRGDETVYTFQDMDGQLRLGSSQNRSARLSGQTTPSCPTSSTTSQSWRQTTSATAM